jgi:hypothetical protein
VSRPLALLRCFAGDLPIGLAADEVIGFHAAEPKLPHIARVLGVTPGPPHAGQRTLSLADGGEAVLVNVDGPVRIRSLASTDILRLPRFFAPGSIAPFVGFAEEDGRVVLLLDVPSVSRIVRDALQGKTPC